MNWQVPLCRPTFDEEQLAALVDGFRSGWLTVGPRAAKLEEAFCEYTGARHAIPVSSCSAALHLATIGAGFGPGDEVIAPSLAFTSTVSAITHVGARPRFAEIAGPDRPWLSAEAVEEAIGERTRGIVTMSYGGHIGEAAELAAIAERHDLALIEDVAHAAGTRHEGRHAGTFGLAGAFSFSSSKNLGIGEGGMLVTDDTDLASHLARLSWHGLGSQAWLRHHQPAPQYELGTLGFNYRFDDPRAGLLLTCLERLDAQNLLRREIDAAYRAELEDAELFTPTEAPPEGEPSSYCMFTGVLDPSVDRDLFREALAERGVQTSVHYPLLHREGVHRQEGLSMPVSEDYGDRCVTLPLYPQMEQWQRELVVESVRDTLSSASVGTVAAA